MRITCFRSLLPVVAFLPLFAGCASIVTGSSDRVTIESQPTGAVFETNTGHRGTTPSMITVPDSQTLVVTAHLDGHEDARAELKPRMSAWFAGNILIGGLLGIAIDLVSGNWQTHDDKLVVTLKPKGAPATAPVAAPKP